MSNPYFTIGHSTRSLGEFAALLQASDVGTVVDVRTVPRSRTNPQFNRDTVPDDLAPFGLAYEHVAELGGLRGRRHAVQPSPNGFWDNQSFRNYADYAMTDEFRAGLDRLRAIGSERSCAIMCAEAVWWRCHRRIITDYLLSRGERVFHILGIGNVQPAAPTAAARRQPDGTLVYQAPADTG